MLPFTPDLTETEHFAAYVNSKPYLLPLRFSSAEFTQEKRRINSRPIDYVTPGVSAFLHLRYFDSTSLRWFDTLNMPDRECEYYVKVEVQEWANRNRSKVSVGCNYFNKNNIVLSTLDVSMYILSITDIVLQRVYVILDDSQDEAIHRIMAPWRLPND